MWNKTKATALLGIEYPIFQGPFGGNLSSVQLTAIVSNAGGLGGYGAYTNSPAEIMEIDKQIKRQTNKPYNLNLWVSDHDVPSSNSTDEQYADAVKVFGPYFDKLNISIPPKPLPFQTRFENQVQVVLDIRPKVFSYMFGTLSEDLLEECRRRGIITVGTATTLDEAIALEASGTDMVIASGFEAGGHRPSFLKSAESSVTGSFVLLQLIREKVRIPVIAAGGIATGRGMAAAFTLGADAVQVGTAFLACEESNALPAHRQALFSDSANYTTLTRAFTGRLGRGIVNTISRELVGKEKYLLPFPLQAQFISSLRTAALDQGKMDMVLFWAGQIAPILKHHSAEVLMSSLIAEATDYFGSLSLGAGTK